MDILIQNLNLDEEIIEIIKGIMVSTMQLFNFDSDYIFDVEIRFQKLEYKLNLKITPLDMVGGEKGLD